MGTKRRCSLIIVAFKPVCIEAGMVLSVVWLCYRLDGWGIVIREPYGVEARFVPQRVNAVWGLLFDTHTHTHRLCNTFCFFTAKMVTRTGLNVTLCVHFRSCMYLIPRINNDCFVVTFTSTFLTVILQEWYHEYSQGLLHCHPYLESVSEATSFRPQVKTLILSNDWPQCNRHIGVNENEEHQPCPSEDIFST